MNIQTVLAGGDRRSLGRAEEVVRRILTGSLTVGELFECLFSTDEIVRMRAGDALEKVCRTQPALVTPFTERLLQDVPRIRQPSVQWHLAQILAELPLSNEQSERAIRLLRYNLHTMNDWIVTNLTLEALAVFARKGALPKNELAHILSAHQTSRYKSVTKRVNKLIQEFTPHA